MAKSENETNAAAPAESDTENIAGAESQTHAPENCGPGDGPELGEAAKTPLASLDAHAMKRRVSAWQHAALLRAMGWVEGKMATDAEYDAALNMLKHRRMGTGRLA